MVVLAELLAERAEAGRALAQVQSRVAAAARVREDEEAEESAVELLAEARQLVRRVGALSAQINTANAAVELELEDGSVVTIAQAIVRREALVQERKVVSAAADAASVERGWGSRSTKEDLRWKSLLPVAELRAEADRLARAVRELDVRLQKANWSSEV